MRKILVNSALHGVKEILLDDDVYEELKNFTWCVQKQGNKFYAMRKHNRTKTIIMHRSIMNVIDRNVYVDHIDGNGLNNQRNNLRLSTHSENLCNRPSVKNSKSIYKGVAWVSSHKKWRASIQANKVQKVLGYFNNEIEAAKAYDAVVKSYHGEFASLNFHK